MLFGGMAHRRADHVAKQVDELGEAIEAVEDQLREPPTPRAPSARRSRACRCRRATACRCAAPTNESIILPVCLPPGFELDSMVLCPEFLPRDQPQPATVARRARRRRRSLRPAGGARPAARERLSGTLQYVFGSGDPGFSMDETFGGEIAADAPPPRRASGVETHHLAWSQAMTSGVATTGPATPLASTNCRTAR